MRVVIDWFFKIEGKTPEQELKIMQGVRDTLKNATMRVGGVQVEPHDVFLYDINTRQGANVDVTPNTLCVILDVDTRTEFV